MMFFCNNVKKAVPPSSAHSLFFVPFLTGGISAYAIFFSNL